MKGIFESLRKTRNTVFGQIMNILGTGEIDDDTWEDLEAVLIQGDVGVETTLNACPEPARAGGRAGVVPHKRLAVAL